MVRRPRRRAHDIDDDAAPSGAHAPIDDPREIDVTVDLEVPGFAPGRAIDLLDGAGRDGAGIVDQDVHVLAGLAQGFDFRSQREVTAVDRNRNAVLLVQPLRGGVEEPFIARRDVEIAAFRGHELGDREADPLRGAGNQDGLALEIDFHF